MKRSYVLLIFLCILFTLFLPLLFFQIQDQYHFQKNFISQEDERFISHQPIIAQLYACAYASNENEVYEGYDLSNIHTYEAAVQEQLHEITDKLEAQIASLRDAQILTDALLLIDQEPYTISYGSLVFASDLQPLNATLNRISSMDENYVESQTFTLCQQADKLTSFEFMNEAVAQLDEEQAVNMMKHMIPYLGLSDIDDWTFIDHHYESYKAKLLIYYELDKTKDGYHRFKMGVMPLGLYQRDQNLLRIYP